MTQAENALANTRLEWVAESTTGTFPADPSWNKFTADSELVGFSYSTSGNKEPRTVLGDIDPVAHDRSTESATATISYRQSRFLIDSSGNIQDPAAYPLTEDDSGQNYPSHTILYRQEIQSGGADGAGWREFAVVTGARPVSSEFDGDPSQGQPIPQELGYEAQRARTHIVHQPSSSGKLVVESTDSNDTNDVILETEDASTTETVTLPGNATNTVETTSDFGDLDAIEVQGDPVGDIKVGTSDGGSPANIDVQLTETAITGSNTDGNDSLQGIPALGSGSHASSVSGTAPNFIGTDLDYDSSAVNDSETRVHGLSLTVERETDSNGQQTTRRESIDVGARTAEAELDLAGPYETATRIKEHFRDKSGDLVWTFDSGEDITLANAEIVDAPDFTREAEDTNYIPGVTMQPNAAVGTAAVQVNHN